MIDFALTDQQAELQHAARDAAGASDAWQALVDGGWLEVALDGDLLVAGLVAEELGRAGLGLPYVEQAVFGPRGRVAAAAVTSAEMAGLLWRLTDLTVRYTGERWQFGRPLAASQVVRHMLADLASTSEAARWLARLAVVEHDDVNTFAAKGWVSRTSGRASAIAQQLHGAIGFTAEYPLAATVRRLRELRFAWYDDSECFSALARAR